MSRHDSPRIHRIPSHSEEGRKLIRSGRVVNLLPDLHGVRCLEITVDEKGFLTRKPVFVKV